MKNKRKGFTLVELAIVLVIIGLLVGGILVAQSLIQTAKITSFVRQIQQYDIAVANFKNQFAQLPGDSSLFTPAGNNDGCINYSDASFNCFAQDRSYISSGAVIEQANFWPHLQQAQMIKESYSNNYASFTAGVQFPKSALNDKVGIMAMTHIHSDSRPNDVDNSIRQGFKMYMLMGNNSAGYPWYDAGQDVADGKSAYPLKCSTLLAVDKKMDDGMPNTGNVLNQTAAQAGMPPTGVLGNGSNGCANWSIAATQSYTMSGTGSIAIKMMSAVPE